MSKYYAKKPKNTSMENHEKQKTNLFCKHMNKIYPIAFHKPRSPLSLSSLSLSLSQNSTDSSLTDHSSSTTFDQKILSALRLIVPVERKEPPVAKTMQKPCEEELTRRCSWITKSSDDVYVQFHDECWGVPAYDDNQMFELLAMCGLLMDYNWTEILKKRQLLREAFAGFDPNIVSKMGENDITDITSDHKELALAESRVRCIVDNAKCITKVARECGSFSNYMWDYVGYKPVINKFRQSRNVPLRSPKAEVISKDLVRRGFRFMGSVIVYSIMQAAGMSIDHLVDCYRYGDCVNIAERPWRHV